MLGCAVRYPTIGRIGHLKTREKLPFVATPLKELGNDVDYHGLSWIIIQIGLNGV